MAAPGYSLKQSVVRERRGEVETLDARPGAAQLRPRDEAVANAVVAFNSPEHAVTVISTLWDEARAKFLAIGRNLREAKQRYPQAFERIILPQLPFGKQVAYQLRVVADAVDHGRLVEGEMPRNYGAAYQLAILDENQFNLARQSSLVRPDVPRREIESWKREIELKVLLESEGQRSVLRSERARLLVESARLEERLAAIKDRITEISNELGADGDDDGHNIRSQK